MSCAGRGELDQEAVFIRKASRAKWTESSHNWNAALDLFELDGDPKDIYERRWFDQVLAPELLDWIVWYGRPGSSFNELPHIEIRDWHYQILKGTLKLVS